MARLSTEARRTQLLAVGRSVFAESTFDTVSIDDLAGRAGVSKGLLYHYFKDKRAFYQDVLLQVASEVMAVSEPHPDDQAANAVSNSLRRFILYVADNEPFYRALVRGGIGTDCRVEAAVEEVREATVNRVATTLERTLNERQRTLIYGWVGMTEFAVLDWLGHRSFSADELAGILLTALLRVLE